MTCTALVAFPGNEVLAASLAGNADMQLVRLATRRFPDGETYLRYLDSVEGQDAAILCTLDRPDGKFLPLLFAAGAARSLGARSVGLLAPYLAYMRQDRRFKPGEAITSAHFAGALSAYFDWLVTVDPHLHRRGDLAEIYSIPTHVIHAMPLIAEWISQNVDRPLLVGPDSESEQWTAATAKLIGAPYVVLEKVRRGDRDVKVSVPAVKRWRDATPVLIDDIISTGRTMIETVGHLARAGMRRAVCIGIHGIFADDAYDRLIAAGAASVVTTNSIGHASNRIDLVPALASALSARAWTASGP